MKTIVVRNVDGILYAEGGYGLSSYQNKHDAEQQALKLASQEPGIIFTTMTLSSRQFAIDPSILWSTPSEPQAWKTQSYRAGWYELWQMKDNEKLSVSNVLLVLHTPELGPGMLKHIVFNLDGTPQVAVSTGYRDIRAFKIRAPNFSREVA